jgi:hypothetical protein
MGLDPNDITVPQVKTGDIQSANFEITNYVVKDGEVEEVAEDTGMSEGDVDSLREEMEAELDDALDQFEETGDPSTVGVDIDPGPVGVDTSPTETETEEPEPEESEEDDEPPEPTDEEGTGSESLDAIAEEAQQREQADRDPIEVGREVVEAEDITTGDWSAFQSAMAEAGVAQNDVSDAWQALKDEGTITGSGTAPPSGDDDGGTDEPAEAEEEPQDETEEAEATIPSGQDLLLVREGSASSERIVEALAEPVMNQEVFVVPIQSDLGEVILEPMDDGVTIPLAVQAERQGFRQRDLADVLEEYA